MLVSGGEREGEEGQFYSNSVGLYVACLWWRGSWRRGDFKAIVLVYTLLSHFKATVQVYTLLVSGGERGEEGRLYSNSVGLHVSCLWLRGRERRGEFKAILLIYTLLSDFEPTVQVYTFLVSGGEGEEGRF